MTRPALVALVLGLAACAPDPAPPAAAPPAGGGGAVADGPAAAPPVDTPAPPSPPGVTITAETRALAGRPVAPVRVVGACPFEGCQYGTWTTTAETTVYAAADTTSAAFAVPAGTALEAEGGFVLVTRVGVSVAVRPTDLPLAYAETTPLAAGDTVLVLDYEGEGSFRVWHGGRIGFSGAGAGVGAPPGGDPADPYRRLVAPRQQWWARVAAPDGRAGWLWMDRTPGVRGADALAAP